ncbi:hypothetical protein [Corynebacterium halotolerans]|uniref:hypothetical protein n=1 Tax=Corynebacterium halotolerans TaxID=225326 RepID=UPI003CF9A4AA
MVAFGLGELPGTSVADAADMILGETGDLVHLPQLPARGLGSDAVGRTAALLEAIHVDRGPRSWIMTPRPQLETRRAKDQIERDLEACETVWDGKARAIKLQVTGPWTLSSRIELTNGHRVITDRGALRDLTESLIDGVREHAEYVARNIKTAHVGEMSPPLTSPEIVVQVDEPMLPEIIAGNLAGSSEFEEIAAVQSTDVAERLHGVIGRLRGGVVSQVLLNQAGYAPNWQVARESGADTVLLTLDQVRGNEQKDGFGRTLSEGTRLGLGVTGPGDVIDELGENPRELAVRIARFFDELGLDRALLATSVDVHPRSGIRQGTVLEAAGAYRMARVVADMLEHDAGDL